MSSGGFIHRPCFEISDNGKLCLSLHYRPALDPKTGLPALWDQPVYSLRDARTGKLLWEHEGNWKYWVRGMFISDDGWSVFHIGSSFPLLLVMSPEGQEVLSVSITSPAMKKLENSSLQSGKWEVWCDEFVRRTRGGTNWNSKARIRFGQIGSKSFFVCRTAWGHYLVLDLCKARVVSEEEALPELVALLRPADHCWALDILKEVRHKRAKLERAIKRREGVCLSPSAMDRLYDNFEIALRIVRQECIKQAAEHLVELQDFQGPLCYRYSHRILTATQPRFGQCYFDQVRRWIHLTLLAVGVKPRGHSMMRFCVANGRKASKPFLKLPQRIPARERLLKTLKPGARIDDVAGLAGAPDAILEDSDLQNAPSEEGAEYERWDYDELDGDGKPFSWGLLWRRAGHKPAKQLYSKPRSHFLRYKTVNKGLAVLVSVTRIEWTAEYRELCDDGLI